MSEMCPALTREGFLVPGFYWVQLRIIGIP